ncbi:MAG: hypothetical protein RPV21_07480 [Candidatus Sedimenticola sp. (ex Thyasira tokunagai)]
MKKLISSTKRFEPEYSDLKLPGVEPDFVLDHWHRLKAPRLVDQGRLISYFTHQIARRPSDLLSHTRRVLFHVSLKDQEGVYGALLDLYLVLGDKGLDLRERMLVKANGYLSDEQKTLFSSHQQSGIFRSQSLPPSSTSVLGNFFTGTSQLVSKGGQVAPELERSVLAHARELLVYGQVEEAQQMLEDAVLADPMDPELNGELLEVYRYKRGKEDLLHMRGLLEGTETAVPEQWQEVTDYLDEAESK